MREREVVKEFTEEGYTLSLIKYETTIDDHTLKTYRLAFTDFPREDFMPGLSLDAENRVKIQTTAYGALDTNQYWDMLQAMQKAHKTAELLRFKAQCYLLEHEDIELEEGI